MMLIDRIRELRNHAQLSDSALAELSGLPSERVNAILSGQEQNPDYASLLVLEEVLATGERIPFTYNPMMREPFVVRETGVPYQYKARNADYDIKDIEKLSEYQRAELIQGVLYMLAAPGRMHQFLVTELLYRIRRHIDDHRGGCRTYTAPFDVRLFADNTTCVLPDILVVCDKKKLTDKGCCGAPDWVIEIVSAGNSKHDYVIKKAQYRNAGVREYWIIDPFRKKLTVYTFASSEEPKIYGYEEVVPSEVLPGFTVRIDDFIGEF